MKQLKELPESYLNVHYEFRPAKQVERRMIVDALQRLSTGGFNILDYQYTGLGSFYFIDFILFHKFLGIKDMLNVEGDQKIRRRVKFNQPYGFIDIEMKMIGEVISTLSEEKKHFLWLDYDQVLHSGILEDLYLAASRLSKGSLLLVTVDVEPPNKDNETPKASMSYLEAQAERYLPLGVTADDFVKENLHLVNSQILNNVIKDAMATRNEEYFPLFFFVYSDGHRMLSIGGIVGADEEKAKIRKSKLATELYIRMDLKKNPYFIEVPRLTRRERLYLDASMPCPDGWKPKDFELSEEQAKAYSEIYRFFPPYAELLL